MTKAKKAIYACKKRDNFEIADKCNHKDSKIIMKSALNGTYHAESPFIFEPLSMPEVVDFTLGNNNLLCSNKCFFIIKLTIFAKILIIYKKNS